MNIRIEPNQRFGHGFQIRATEGPYCEVYDDEPLTMLEALQTLDEVMGREPSRMTVGRIGPQGTPSGPEVIVFQSAPDVRKGAANAKGHPVMSPMGVIMMAWAAWRNDGMPKAKDVMRRYCEYISAHGYHGGAAKAMTELETMSFQHGAQWIKRTFAQCVRDGVALVSCVLPEQ